MSAVAKVSGDLLKASLKVEGFDFIFPQQFMDRALTVYEEQLLSKLEKEDTLYDTIHYFPADD